MLHGSQKEGVEITFSLPSKCARDIERGTSDVGLVPVTEIARQGLQLVEGVGICCRGAVRSILLFSLVPFQQIRTLAVDSSSRTSVQLAQIILRERYGAQPQLFSDQPLLDRMLAHADAALIIGDPALVLDPDKLGHRWLDLGSEWCLLTGLPMVFAAWACKQGVPLTGVQALTVGSYKFGRANLSAIVDHEYGIRGITRDLATRYLSENIQFELGGAEKRGLETFLKLANLSRLALAGNS